MYLINQSLKILLSILVSQAGLLICSRETESHTWIEASLMAGVTEGLY